MIMLKTKINQQSKLIQRKRTSENLSSQSLRSFGNLHFINKSSVVVNKSSSNGLFTAEFEINDVRISARNILTKGQTHDEIGQFSGASISTRGRYISQAEKSKGFFQSRSLYLFIQGNTQNSVSLAIQKINEIITKDSQNLTENKNLFSGMAKFNNREPPPLPSQQNSTFVEKLMIGLDHAPPSFNIREQVIGPGGANLHYIRNETGAVATLRGRGSLFIEPVLGIESTESLHLYIEHSRYDGLQAAKQLAKNLIETLQQELVHFQQLNPNSQNGPYSGNGNIIQQNQINIPPPMLAVPPPAIQQTSIDPQVNSSTIVQQNFIQQNPPPNLAVAQQGTPAQTIIHQQILPQTVPIQLQQGNMVIQQSSNIGNVNIPPPGIPIPIKGGQIVQFSGPPPPAANTVHSHLTQPPPNIQLQHQPPATTQIVLNHPQNYQYQYIQQPVPTQDHQIQSNQVTIQHIYQPQHQIAEITLPQSQTQTFEPLQQMRSQHLQTNPAQQYITLQGNAAYMMPPPTIIHQQPTSNQHSQAHVQTITTSNPNIIFQPSHQLHQVQMHMARGISLENVPPSLPSSIQEHSNQLNNTEENINVSSIKEEKLETDQTDNSLSEKSSEEKFENIIQSNDNCGIPENQTSTLTATQVPPPIMAAPPPITCVQHFVGNTLITTNPNAQNHTNQIHTNQIHTNQIYNQIPVSIQQIQSTGSQIHVSTPAGQHFVVNTAPQWQSGPSAVTQIQQQQNIQQIPPNGTTGGDFRGIPPPNVAVNSVTQASQSQQPMMTFNPHAHVLQFQPQMLQQIPPTQQFNLVQSQQSQLSNCGITSSGYQTTAITSFQQPAKQIPLLDQSNRNRQKRKHDGDDLGPVSQQLPRIGMGPRDQIQHQQQQSMPHGNPLTTQSSSGSSINNTSSNSQVETNDNDQKPKTEFDQHQKMLQMHNEAPPPPPMSMTQQFFQDNRPLYQRDGNETFGEFPTRFPFDNPMGSISTTSSQGPRGLRFHHNNGLGNGSGFSMRPSFHSDIANNFQIHRMNFGPPPPPPYRGDCSTNGTGPLPSHPRFRGQW